MLIDLDIYGWFVNSNRILPLLIHSQEDKELEPIRNYLEILDIDYNNSDKINHPNINGIIVCLSQNEFECLIKKFNTNNSVITTGSFFKNTNLRRKRQ